MTWDTHDSADGTDSERQDDPLTTLQANYRKLNADFKALADRMDRIEESIRALGADHGIYV
jgi:hypothetical protein